MGKRYSKNEVYENRFYKIPKAFFKTEEYKDMSLYSKVIYGFLDDRRELSLKNNWVDKENNIYLIFTRKEIQDMLCLSDKPVSRAFQELTKKGLIEEVVQGLNKPNLIYVCHIDFTNIENMRTRKNSDSRIGDNTTQESEIIRCNDTDLNKTDQKETEKILHHLSQSDDTFILEYLLIMDNYGFRHKRVNEENYNKILTEISDLKGDGIELDDWVSAVEEHFENLPEGNDGDINCFLTASRRYFG